MSQKICVVTGVGPGTGLALTKRFATEYTVAMIARNESRLTEYEADVENTRKYVCDISDPEQLESTWQSINDELGSPDVVVQNAVRGTFGTFDSVSRRDFERNFAVNTTSTLHLAQLAAPNMVDNKRGVIIATGNTAGYRGVPNFAGFAPSCAAQRVLLESIARTLGPKGVHVGYVSIDAVIDLERQRANFPDRPDEFFCKPVDIAEQTWMLAHQPRSAWTFDITIRPFGERW